MPRSANREIPYLSHLRTHHGQVTLVPPNSPARVRKPSTGRSGRNPCVYDPPSPRGRRGTTQISRPSVHAQLDVDMPIPDFPPPSFQEAITSPVYSMQEIAMSDASFSSYHSIQRSPSVDSYPTTSASSPTSQYEDAFDVDVADISHPLPRSSTSDTSSNVGSSPAEWEVERQRGIPLEERVRRERERREQAEVTHPGATPSIPTSNSRTRSCSHCGGSSKPQTDDRRTRQAEMVPRRRGFLRHRHSQSLSSASVPSTPIRSRPRTSLKSTSSSRRKSRSMSPGPSLITPMSTSTSLGLMSRKLFAHSNKGKDRSTKDEPLESWEVLESGSLPAPIPEAEIPQPPVSRVRRTLSRMSLSALTAINTQTEAGGNGSIEPYSFEPSFPSAMTEKSRLKQSDPPAPTDNMPPSLQRDDPPTPTPTPPPVTASSPLMTGSFPLLSYAPPPTPSMNMTTPTPDIIPTRPAGLTDPRQVQTSPLISPVAMRLGARQRVKSMSVRAGPPSSIMFPKVDPRGTPNSKLRKHATAPIDPSSPLAVLNGFPDVPPINTHFEKPTQDRGSRFSLSTIRPSPSPPVPALELLTPTRHHYPGRPLPTPPAGVPPSPSAYESLLLPRSATVTRFALALNATNGAGSTTMTERSTATTSSLSYLTDRPPSPISIASGSSIAEVINEADGDTLGRGVADLGLLISRIESNDGGTYQDPPTVSEAIGEVERPGTARPHDRLEDPVGVPLVSQIEVQRRRKLKDGRVKLKLRLMGVPVNNCGICLMQFKDEEMGALTPNCQHPYHEKCLKMWLQRNPTCPSCRSPLKQL